MQIRNRLKKIASLTPKGDRVIDIGCDHALLDIYLTLYNSNKCIASDVNINALENAKNNINRYNLGNEIDLVLSDGFKNIDINCECTAIICGMGTSTIIDILSTNKIKFLNKIIVQSNNDLYTLRRNVIKKGYYIDSEIVVKERNIFYVLIRFKKGHKKYNINDLWLGPIIRTTNEEINIDYLSHLFELNSYIYNKLPNKYFIKKIMLKIKLCIIKRTISSFKEKK